MISPTGYGIRHHDDHGFGLYGKPRSGKDRHGIKKIHKGADFICVPGQKIVAPADGNVVRIKLPYSKPIHGILFSGLLIRASDYEYTLFYFSPLNEVLKSRIQEGQLIGYAQDISIKYSRMTPHIHMQIDSINPELFIRLP